VWCVSSRPSEQNPQKTEQEEDRHGHGHDSITSHDSHVTPHLIHVKERVFRSTLHLEFQHCILYVIE
jgi:hypothetical protein